MIWQDKGFLLSINKYSENSVIADFYTENYGKTTGIIFGATSKKIKNYLLIGNKFHLNIASNQNGKVGYFKIEIDKIYTPFYLEEKKKLFCIIYTMNLVKILTMENQSNKTIYCLIENLFEILNEDFWLLNFIFWELKFYKITGYHINFAEYVNNVQIEGDEKFIVESNKKIIPNFLVDKTILPKNNYEILNGYKIVGDFLEKTILRPNNIAFPISRVEFLNLIK